MEDANLRNGSLFKYHPMLPHHRLLRTTWGKLFPTSHPDWRWLRLVPGACAVVFYPHPSPHPHRAPALSPGFSAAAGIGHPGADGPGRTMAEGEDMQTFTSIMDALVRISVS